MTTDHATDLATTEVAHAIGPDGVLAISVPDGDVQVRVTDDDTVRVRTLDGSPLDGFDIERGAGSLAVRWRSRGWRGGHHAPDLRVDTPVRASLVIEAASADLDVAGVRGDQRLRTASGDVTVREAGGSIAVEAVSGDVEIEASSAVRIEARTVSGDLGLRAGAIGALRVATTSGDVHIAGRFERPGPFSIRSVSGDTVVAPAGGVRVEVRTIAGDVRSERPGRAEGGRGRRSFVIEEGGPTIEISSTSGDVAIVRAAALPIPRAAPTPAVPPAPLTPPAPPAPPDPDPEGADVVVAADDARLGVLEALERGDIDIDEARRRLEALDEIGETDHA